MNIANMLNQEPKIINGILVGGPLCFSDTILKISNGEMDCVQFIRLESFSDLTSLVETASDEQRALVRNILVDEAMITEFCASVAELHIAFPNTQFALAYRQPQNANHIIEWANQNPDLRQISLLPMHLEVDRWLSVLRLLICGEHYVPSELMVQRLQEPQGATTPSSADTGATTASDTTEPVPKAQDTVPPDPERDDGTRIRLTQREIQVLKFAAEGKPNKIIAEELRLSQHTIKLHMHHLMVKLGVHNRTEAAIWFFDHQNEVARP